MRVLLSKISFVFCFVKQKTAYEMRISDWSSDVCSSDLARGHGHLVAQLHQSSSNAGMDRRRTRGCANGRPTIAPRGLGADVASLFAGSGDRTSVVSGKSVSVRVDLGGRRIIKKKHNNIQQLLLHYTKFRISKSII